MNFMQGTAFEFTEDCVNNQYRWMFENFRHQIFYKYFSAGTAGRGVTRGEAETGAIKDLICNYVKMRSYAPDEWKGKFDSLIRRLMHNTGSDYSSFHAMWPHLAKYCIDIYNDDSVIPDEDYLVTRVWNRMARAAHHNKHYGAALVMSSDTIHKYESINGENQRGWYFSDGFLMLYPHEKTRNHGKEFFLYSNPYLRTSVTANTAERVAKCIHPSIQNGSPYAGGVECGKYGSAGFVLKYKDGFTQGTFTNANDSKITANKSWFFFDNEIVCLGSDITDKSGTPVITCIDNCQWLEGESLSVEGKAYSPAEETEISGKYAHFTGIGGYVFFDDNKVKYKKATHNNLFKAEDTQTYDFLEIVMHHGIGDEKLNGAYAYAYLPASSEEKTASYSKNPDIEILSLTKNVHAVYEKNLGILAVNFFDADKFEGKGYSIEAKTVSSLMIENGTLYLSDPTGKLDFVELTVNGKSISQKTSDTYGKTYLIPLN
jgi:hyaluronate lyase